MAVVFIKGDAPSYQVLSTDLNGSGSVAGISWIGAEVVATDTGDVYRVNSDRTLAKVPRQFITAPDLALNASNLTLVLSGSKGSAPIADATRYVGLYTTGSTVRVGLELCATTTGSSSGSAASASDYQKGFVLPASAWKYFNVGPGVNRTLYFASGSPSNTIQIVQA